MMTTEIVIYDEQGLAELSKADKEIARLTPYLDLQVKSLDDNDGLAKVHKARMDVRSVRTGVEKARVELKARALEFGRKVDTEARRIALLIEPIESHLLEQESVVKREKERLAKIEQEKKDAAIRAKLEKLASFGVIRTASDIAGYSEPEFEWLLQDSEKKFLAKQEAEAAERKRMAEEAETLRIERERQSAEAERLRLERERQEAEVQRLKAERLAEEQKLRAEREAIEAEKRRLEREEFERQARIKAEAEARERLEREARERIEAEDRRRREEAERIECERLEAIEAERQAELLKTDWQRIGDLARRIEAIEQPVVSSKEAKLRVGKIFRLLAQARELCSSQ